MSRHARRPRRLLSRGEQAMWTGLALVALLAPPGLTAGAAYLADRTPPALPSVLPTPASTSPGATSCWAYVPGGACVPLIEREFRG